MDKKLIENMDTDQLEALRNAAMAFIEYSFGLEETMSKVDPSCRNDINFGQNGFEKLRNLMDYSNAILTTANSMLSIMRKHKIAELNET